MQRYAFALAIAATLAAAGSTARADGFWERVSIDWHRVNSWPEPFQREDRAAARAPFISMINSGWRLQNTLGDDFFDPQTQTLNRAGQLKLHSMATQTPVHRRSVYLLRSIDPGVTAARMQSVQHYLAQLFPEGSSPEVMLSDVVPIGGSGSYVDELQRQIHSSIPPPRLPERQLTTGG